MFTFHNAENQKWRSGFSLGDFSLSTPTKENLQTFYPFLQWRKAKNGKQPFCPTAWGLGGFSLPENNLQSFFTFDNREKKNTVENSPFFQRCAFHVFTSPFAFFTFNNGEKHRQGVLRKWAHLAQGRTGQGPGN